MWNQTTFIVIAAVLVAAGVVVYLLTKHKEKPSNDHILKF